MTAGPWVLTIDWLGRPTTANAAHNMHHQKLSARRKLYREAGWALARAAKIGPREAITVEAWGRYPDRRSLPDVDAIAPALKGVIDGIVDAGVIPDDTAAHLAAVTYRAPVIGAGLPPALIVRLTLDGAA